MALLPENHAARIAWFQSRLALWTSNHSQIGTTSADVTNVSTKATAAAAALAAQLDAQNTAKAATETLFNAMDALTNAGMIVVEQVRTKSRSAGPDVFPLANIPAPAAHSHKAAPGQPTDFVATLLVGGDVDMAWKCAQPAGAAGTTYQVYRRFVAGAEWEYLGTSGERKFTDATIPAGTQFVMYKIRGLRSTVAGPWNEFNVTFGAGVSEMTGAVTTVSPKIAA